MSATRVSFGVLVLLVLWLAALPAGVAAPPGPEAFGRLPEFNSVALSPNGRLIAWEQNQGNHRTVVILDLDGGKTAGTVPLTDKLRKLQWSDDTTLLLSISAPVRYEAAGRRTYEVSRTMALNVTNHKSCMLLMNDAARQYVTGATLHATHTGKPRTVVMSSWDYRDTEYRQETGTRLAGKRKDSGWVYGVFAVDTVTCRGTALDYGTQFTDDWVIDTSGHPVARSDWQPALARYTVMGKDGAGWRVLLTLENKGTLDLGGLSSDGRAVLAIGAAGSERSKLWSLPLDGSEAKALVDDPDRDVTDFIYDGFTGAPLGVHLGGSPAKIHWLDARAEKRHAGVVKAFAGRAASIASHSENFERLITRVQAPSEPPVYYLVNFAASKADIIGEAYPELVGTKLGDVRTISYAARDGTSIPAYVTIPSGGKDTNLPLVVLPHGGPESQDMLAFDWWAQFLASRGYAVLQPQFRGSTGFGEAHRLAGHRQWGGRMQDDVTDGVKFLITQGLADPKRVCIVGENYGGYAALAGAAFTPELYACAAAVNGMFDLPEHLFYDETRQGDEADKVFYLRELIGSRFDVNVIEKSPARAAAAIRIPVLLMHGESDTIVPFSQSEKMYKALEAVNRPARLVRLPGEDHWLSRAETRIRMLTELEGFLAQHIGATAPGAAGGS